MPKRKKVKLRLNSKSKRSLNLECIQELILYLLCSEKAPTWVAIRESYSINKVVVVYIPSLPTEYFVETENGFECSELPSIQEIFSRLWRILISCKRGEIGSPIWDVLRLKAGRDKGRDCVERLVSPLEYLLPLEAQRELDYPLMSMQSDDGREGWLEVTDCDGILPDASDILAIDCEMCITTQGSELTRVSIVRYMTKAVVYDTLVKPPNPITDYVTAYSGITSTMLESVETTLKDVHVKLRQLVKPSTILLGHSLQFDLNALKFSHPFIIDTSTIYSDSRNDSYRPKLKWLTARYLGRRIQEDESGHNSIEDALACIDLLQLKITKGPAFGKMPIFGRTLFELFREASLKSACIDSLPLDNVFVPDVKFQIDGIDDIAENFKKVSEGVNFVWTAVRDTFIGVDNNDEMLMKLDNLIASIWEQLEPNTAFVIHGGPGDLEEIEKLKKAKRDFRQEYREKNWNLIENVWGIEQEKQLDKAIEKARSTLAFMVVK